MAAFAFELPLLICLLGWPIVLVCWVCWCAGVVDVLEVLTGQAPYTKQRLSIVKYARQGQHAQHTSTPNPCHPGLALRVEARSVFLR